MAGALRRDQYIDVTGIDPLKNGRSGGIRTHDPLTPSQVRYRAALRSDLPKRPVCSSFSVLVTQEVKRTGERKKENKRRQGSGKATQIPIESPITRDGSLVAHQIQIFHQASIGCATVGQSEKALGVARAFLDVELDKYVTAVVLDAHFARVVARTRVLKCITDKYGLGILIITRVRLRLAAVVLMRIPPRPAFCRSPSTLGVSAESTIKSILATLAPTTVTGLRFGTASAVVEFVFDDSFNVTDWFAWIETIEPAGTPSVVLFEMRHLTPPFVRN